MTTEYVRVTLIKPDGITKKRTSVRHEFLNEDFKATSKERISIKEFYDDYYSRKSTAWCVYESDEMISLYFEN
jgi:hypothetical protein